MKTIFTLLFSLAFTFAALAQTTLSGKVTDSDNNEAIPFANVILYQNGAIKYSANTDFDGKYSIEILAGKYDVTVAYVGYPDTKIEGLIIEERHDNKLNIAMSSSMVTLEEVVVTEYKVPLVQQDNTTQGRVVTSQEIAEMPKVKAPAHYGVRSTKKAASRSNTLNYANDVHLKGNKNKAKSSTASSPATQQQNKPQKSNVAPAKRELPSAGLLTAGRWNDLENKDYWKEIVEEDLLQWRNHWQMHPMRVVELELLNKAGKPLSDATVQLFDNQSNTKDKAIWTARTDNRGKVALWAVPFSSPTANKNFRAAVIFDGKTYDLDIKNLKNKKNKQLKVNVPCENAVNVDILFAIDVSGSMKDELRFLQAELTNVIERASALNDELRFRTASVCYQSPGDEYITKSSEFTEDAALTTNFFGLQKAIGGKGGPEAVERGLAAALSLNWSENATARILFLLLDEPPGHDSKSLKKLQRVSQRAAEKGIKIIPVVGSGAKRDLEFLMRSLALLTNGDYVFLTDHSDIGDSHLEPAIDSYEVEFLNDLMVKIISENIKVDKCEWLENEEEETAKFRPYPNPAREQIFVDTKLTIKTLCLYDSAGKQILKEQFAPNAQLVLNLPDLPDGIYFLEGWTADKRVTSQAVMVSQSVQNNTRK